MAQSEQQAALLKEIQVRFDRKLKENEISLLEYWKERVDRVAVMKPEGIATIAERTEEGDGFVKRPQARRANPEE